MNPKKINQKTKRKTKKTLQKSTSLLQEPSITQIFLKEKLWD